MMALELDSRRKNEHHKTAVRIILEIKIAGCDVMSNAVDKTLVINAEVKLL